MQEPVPGISAKPDEGNARYVCGRRTDGPSSRRETRMSATDHVSWFDSLLRFYFIRLFVVGLVFFFFYITFSALSR